MENSRLYDKVYGCLLGGLIGDAMGAPVENWHYRKIIEKYGELCDFDGDGTDDSVIKGALCKALIEHDGDITADEFAQVLVDDPACLEAGWVPVKNLIYKLRNKLCLPIDGGIGNMQSTSSAMAISPMGIINAGNPRQAALETYDVAGVVHAGPTNFCRDAACAMAAAVAEAFHPDATVDTILQSTTRWLHPVSAHTMLGLIRDVLAMAEDTGSYQAFRDRFYGSAYVCDVICDSRETVPVALALFRLAEGDPVRSILYAANFGRDADTLATMVGSLAGAFRGAGALKAEWVAKIECNGDRQKELARQMLQVLRNKSARGAAIAAKMAQL